MKAMLIRRYGGPEVFEPGEAPAPRPSRGEILVRVRGSSVNPVDTAIRSGMLRSQGAGTYDVVLNAVRGPSLRRLRSLPRPGGVVVTLTGIPPQAAWMRPRNLVSSRRTVIMFVSTSGAILEGLAKLIEEGKVRPIVEKTYSWNELAEAHRRVETQRVVGKVAVVPPERGGAA